VITAGVPLEFVSDPFTRTPQSPEFSEDELALNFTARYEESLRFVAKWGKWLRWHGARWREDSVLSVFDNARSICREAADRAQEKPRIAKQLTTAATVAAIERLARWDQRTAGTVEQWDRDEWLLNTPAGSVDLRTGELRPNRREDYCTKATAIAPGGECPTWLRFLKRITDGDAELEAFLQRMCGYTLTGSTREEALFFLYGTGANGKSKFLNAIAGVLGDYARTAPCETFMATKGEHHPTDLAGLQGARLVSAIETEEGRRWAESKITALTGRDKISARFMRQDFFDFLPQFKLVVAGNHKPSLRSTNEAIRRRFNLVPFEVTIPVGERDVNLGDKLQAEWPGILQWAIDGCMAWQRVGLAAPACVKAATEAYMAAEDVFAQWLEERCVTGNRNVCSGQSSKLYADYCRWCVGANEKAMPSKKFSPELELRGFPKESSMVGMMFYGIALKEIL